MAKLAIQKEVEEMRQYCRYCANLCMGDAVYCNHKGVTMSEKSIYRPNNCKYYDYCGMNENNEPHVQREQKRKNKIDNISLF